MKGGRDGGTDSEERRSTSLAFNLHAPDLRRLSAHVSLRFEAALANSVAFLSARVASSSSKDTVRCLARPSVIAYKLSSYSLLPLPVGTAVSV